MKTLALLALAVVTIAGSVSSACSPKEAQFIGKVKVVNKAIDADGEVKCTIQVGEFRFYQESMLCPLDEAIASSIALPARSCDVQVGEEVSSILSMDEAGNVTW